MTEGQSFPDFSLANQSGTIVSLNDLIGTPTIVYFYPKDDTSGCTIEACEFRDTLPNFGGAKVYGVSPDSAKSHTKFIEKFQLNFDLLADTEQTLCNACDVSARCRRHDREDLAQGEAAGTRRRSWRRTSQAQRLVNLALMPKRKTAPAIRAMKGGELIVCLTAYDATTGALADAAGVDLILVGDSVGNTVLGYDTTVPVTLEDMIYHVRAVRRSVSQALLVADMPLGSYGSSVAQAVDSAVALAKAGAEAVKLEGAFCEEIAAIQRIGIPVMGHVGMTPQSVNLFGGFKVQGRDDAAEAVFEAARLVAGAGAFSIVLELIPAPLAARITQEIHIPTIGIGAGAQCDGQVQVFHDLVGMTPHRFRHAKRYMDAWESMGSSIAQYAAEVRGKQFPSDEHSA